MWSVLHELMSRPWLFEFVRMLLVYPAVLSDNSSEMATGASAWSLCTRLNTRQFMCFACQAARAPSQGRRGGAQGVRRGVRRGRVGRAHTLGGDSSDN